MPAGSPAVTARRGSGVDMATFSNKRAAIKGAAIKKADASIGLEGYFSISRSSMKAEARSCCNQSL
ncbi:hypothetical protein D3C78_1912630 [compost metagenome]